MNEFVCPDCHQTIYYGEGENLYIVMANHQKKCPSAQKQPTAHRITEVVPDDVLRGNFVMMDELLGKEILIKAISWQDSTFKEDAEYLSLTIDLNGEERILNTGALRIIDVFRYVNNKDLPMYASFEKVTLPGGRRAYRVK